MFFCPALATAREVHGISIGSATEFSEQMEDYSSHPELLGYIVAVFSKVAAHEKLTRTATKVGSHKRPKKVTKVTPQSPNQPTTSAAPDPFRHDPPKTTGTSTEKGIGKGKALANGKTVPKRSRPHTGASLQHRLPLTSDPSSKQHNKGKSHAKGHTDVHSSQAVGTLKQLSPSTPRATTKPTQPRRTTSVPTKPTRPKKLYSANAGSDEEWTPQTELKRPRGKRLRRVKSCKDSRRSNSSDTKIS